MCSPCEVEEDTLWRLTQTKSRMGLSDVHCGRVTTAQTSYELTVRDHNAVFEHEQHSKLADSFSIFVYFSLIFNMLIFIHVSVPAAPTIVEGHAGRAQQ